jgi:hypothetical protein
MSIVSHLHHLFNPATCQAYIHKCSELITSGALLDYIDIAS